jgi:hypothetical protein
MRDAANAGAMGWSRTRRCGNEPRHFTAAGDRPRAKDDDREYLSVLKNER